MTDRKKHQENARAVMAALLEEPVDEGEARAAVQELGIDVKALAGRLKAQVNEQEKHDRAQRFARLEQQRAAELARLQAEDLAEHAPRAELLTMMSALVKQAGPAASVHFMKFEEATDEELAEMIRSLRYLVSDGEES